MQGSWRPITSNGVVSILDKETLVAEMKNHLAKEKITTKDVIFTVSSTKIANREVVIPLVPENKIRAVIDANATEYFPLDISEYTISYSILDKINTKDEKKLKLLLLAAPNNLIKNIYNFKEYFMEAPNGSPYDSSDVKAFSKVSYAD